MALAIKVHKTLIKNLEALPKITSLYKIKETMSFTYNCLRQSEP